MKNALFVLLLIVGFCSFITKTKLISYRDQEALHGKVRTYIELSYEADNLGTIDSANVTSEKTLSFDKKGRLLTESYFYGDESYSYEAFYNENGTLKNVSGADLDERYSEHDELGRFKKSTVYTAESYDQPWHNYFTWEGSRLKSTKYIDADWDQECHFIRNTLGFESVTITVDEGKDTSSVLFYDYLELDKQENWLYRRVEDTVSKDISYEVRVYTYF